MVEGVEAEGFGSGAELERKAGAVQYARAPAWLQWSVDYFLAIAICVAAAYRRFTSVQFTFRKKASTYALRSLP